jgi:uncharacterized membrane protein
LERVKDETISSHSTMLLAQHQRKNSNGDQLIGLVDGVSAIVITLLTIELPLLIIKKIERGGGISSVYHTVTLNVIAYFFVSIIVYDIWSIQKNLFQSAKSSTSQNLTCISTLWLSTLIPPMLYVAEHFNTEGEIRGASAWPGPESIVFRTITLLIILTIHLILFKYSTKKSVIIDSDTFEYASKLLRLRVIALTVIIPSSLMIVRQAPHHLLAPFALFVVFLFIPIKMERTT